MIHLWDIIILRLLIPIRFAFQVKDNFYTQKYFIVHKNMVFYRNTYLNWMVKGIERISLTLTVCYVGMAFYSYFKLFSRKQLCHLEWVKGWEREKGISVFESQDIPSACVCGIWKPIILIPSLLREDEKPAFLILEHERFHILNCDMLRKHVIQILICFHWYNPAFWILMKQVLEDQEITCDEAVIEEYGDSVRVEYAKLLLSTIKIKYPKNEIWFNKNFIKERVRCVLIDRKKKNLTIFGVFATLFIVGVSCVKLTASEKKEPFPGNQIVYETEWNEEGTHYHYAEIIAYLDFEEIEETQEWNEKD